MNVQVDAMLTPRRQLRPNPLVNENTVNHRLSGSQTIAHKMILTPGVFLVFFRALISESTFN